MTRPTGQPVSCHLQHVVGSRRIPAALVIRAGPFAPNGTGRAGVRAFARRPFTGRLAESAIIPVPVARCPVGLARAVRLFVAAFAPVVPRRPVIRLARSIRLAESTIFPFPVARRPVGLARAVRLFITAFAPVLPLSRVRLIPGRPRITRRTGTGGRARRLGRGFLPAVAEIVEVAGGWGRLHRRDTVREGPGESKRKAR